MTPEEFKRRKAEEQRILDFEDEVEDNGGLPCEDDPQDWCPENW